MKKGMKYLVSIIIAVMIFILATNIFAIEKSSYTDAKLSWVSSSPGDSDI